MDTCTWSVWSEGPLYDFQPVAGNQTVNNGRKNVNAILLKPVVVDKSNIDETVIRDGFHQRADIYRQHVDILLNKDLAYVKDGAIRFRMTRDPILIPDLVVDDPSGEARVLVLGWGSTYGPIGAAVRQVRNAGLDIAQAHLRHLNPFPKDLGDVLKSYDAVMVPEMNLGQLSMLLRAKYLVDVVGYNEVRGLPLKAAELADAIAELVSEAEGVPVDLTQATDPEPAHTDLEAAK